VCVCVCVCVYIGRYTYIFYTLTLTADYVIVFINIIKTEEKLLVYIIDMGFYFYSQKHEKRNLYFNYT